MAGYAGIPPGPLSAYLGVREANRASGLQELGILQKMQEAQEQRKLREALATQGDVRQRDLAQMSHLDRQAQLGATLEMGKSRLQQQANQLEMQNQWKEMQFGQIKDEAARKLASDAW